MILFAGAVITALSLIAIVIRKSAPGYGVILLGGAVVITIALFKWGHAAEAIPTLLHGSHR